MRNNYSVRLTNKLSQHPEHKLLVIYLSIIESLARNLMFGLQGKLCGII